MNSPNFTSKLYVFGGVCLLLFTLMQISLHYLRPDVGVFSGFISEYGVGEFSWFFVISLVFLALSKFILIRLLPAEKFLLPAKLFLIISAGCTLLVGVFPTDIGAERTLTGSLHLLSAYGSFGATAVYLLALATALRNNRISWTNWLVFGFNIACIGAFFLVPTEFKGLAERVLLASVVTGLINYYLRAYKNFPKV